MKRMLLLLILVFALGGCISVDVERKEDDDKDDDSRLPAEQPTVAFVEPAGG